MIQLPKYILIKAGLPWFLLSAGINLIGAALTLLQALFIAKIVNAVFIDRQNVYDLTLWFSGLLSVMAARPLAQWGSEAAAVQFAGRIKSHLRKRLLQSLFQLGPVGIKELKTGELVGLLTTGIDALEPYLAKYLPQLIITGTVPILVLTVAAPIDPLTGLLLLLTAPALPVFLALIGRWAEGAQQKQWEQIGRIAGHFLDVLQGLLTLRIFGRSREQLPVIKRLSGQVADGALQVLKIAFLSAFMLELTATISTAIIAVTVGLRLLYGSMIFEHAFLILLLVPEFFQPFRVFGASYHAGLAGVTVIENIERLICKSEHEGVLKLTRRDTEESLVSTIIFDDVWFTYPDRQEEALAGVSFLLQHGEKVALVGTSGSGKSTIAALLLGFIQPCKGQIRVNGVLSKGLPASSVTYLPQNPYIFQGTIADNIRIGRTEAGMDEVKKAAVLAEADDFIVALPQGYQTVVGERGYGLSGGEKQRIAIARAFLRETPVIILDEPTASLDFITEANLRRTLDKLAKGKTVLMIAHKTATIRSADRIIVLADGKISRTTSAMGGNIC